MPQSKDTISIESANTLDGLFFDRCQRSPDAIAYRQFNNNSQKWQNYTWQEIAEQVSVWQQAIQSEGLQTGDRVALLMRNSIEWVIADQAALSLGLVIVPLYCDDRPDNIHYILEDSATRLLIAHEAMWRRISSACSDLTSLQCVVSIGSDEESITEKNVKQHVVSDKNWLSATPKILEKRQSDSHELATIVYTSGTTGNPKGVMLSHHNILFVSESALLTYAIYTDDDFLSFLPFSHTFERSIGYYLPMMAGAIVSFSRSIALLADDMREIRPTAMVAVPRIFDRILARIQHELQKKSFISRGLFKLTVRSGWWRFQKQQQRGTLVKNILAALLNPSLDKFIAQKIRDVMGGRLRLTVSGGAALPLPIAETFLGLGITITQGYGLTETSPVISGNPLDNNDPASVGIALTGIETRIGDNDELLVKTPGMMLGYWNNHNATAEIIDADGWLHTGDQANIINEHIYITGRIKDILILSNGEKFPPTDIENTICVEALYEQVMLVGEGQAFLSAIIVLNRESFITLSHTLAINPYEEDSLHSAELQRYVISHLRKLLHAYPAYAKVRRVILTLEPWTIDNGLLTPTLKVKRNKVIEQFQSSIDEIYQ